MSAPWRLVYVTTVQPFSKASFLGFFLSCATASAAAGFFFSHRRRWPFLRKQVRKQVRDLQSQDLGRPLLIVLPMAFDEPEFVHRVPVRQLFVVVAQNARAFVHLAVPERVPDGLRFRPLLR